MRKVTKRLLVACVAALVVGACQDSVTIVDPPPPPPPPPPPTVDATVTVQGLRSIPANAPVNPTAVAGDINVVLNVEEGDETVTQVDLLLDGDVLGCQSTSASAAPAGGVSLSQSGGADTVECFFNTDDVVGACVGEQLDPAHPNGVHTLGARVTLDDGTTRDATNTQQITLVNASFLLVTHLGGGQGVIGQNGRRYWGGEDVQFAVCPVSYAGTDVGQVSFVGTTDPAPVSAGSVNFGPGGGAVSTDAATPFVFTATPGRNDLVVSGGGDAGTGAEDNPFGLGHTLNATGSVFATDGSNVTAEFAAPAAPAFPPPPAGTFPGGLRQVFIQNFYLDWVAPRVNTPAASQIVINQPAAGSSTMAVHYSTGTFGLSNVVENTASAAVQGGVGWSFGAGAQLDVGNCSTAANSDAADATAFVPLFADVKTIADVTEDDPVANADTNGADCYLGELRSLEDVLGNATLLNDPGSIPAQIQTATAFGKDATMANITAPQPDPSISPFILNPDDENDGVLDGVNDYLLAFNAADPNLESGDAGSTVDETGCAAFSGCAFVTAAASTRPTGAVAAPPVGNNGTLSTDKGGANADFRIDLGNTIALQPDGGYVVTATVRDMAVPRNAATQTFTFTLDNTAPSITIINPPASNVGPVTNATAVFDFQGTGADANGLSALTVFVTMPGADLTCGTADDPAFPQGGGAGQVDDNSRTIDVSAGGTISFNERFVFNNTGDTTNQTVCFNARGSDNGLRLNGTAAPNVNTQSTQTIIDWQ